MSLHKSKSTPVKQTPKILEIEKDVRAALISDVEDLLKQFSDGPLTYESFLQCYKEADFWTIFIGRISPADEYEFAEEFFHHVVSFIFPVHMRHDNESSKKPASSKEMQVELEKTEQLFGIFLCYTAFFMQPQTDVRLIKLRIDLAEYLPNIMKTLTQEKQFHALYCLHRLISAKAFMIVPFDEDHNPLLLRQLNPIQESETKTADIVDFEQLHSVVESPDIKYLSELQEKYEALKKKLNVPKEFAQPGIDISSVLSNAASEAADRYNMTPEVRHKTKKASILEKVASIRNKAYNSEIIIPRHRRHQFGIDIDADGTEFEQPRSESEEGEPGPSTSEKDNVGKGRPKRAKKGHKELDYIQIRAKASITRAQHKSERIRRQTLTEGEELSERELIRKEVEADVAEAIARSTRRSSPRKSRTESKTDSESASPTGKKRSQRTSRSRATDSVTLSTTDQGSAEVTEEALKALECSQEADFALRKLKSLKK